MIISVIFLTMSSTNSQAQIIATTVDKVASPRSLSGCAVSGSITPLNVVNTGYDIFQVNPSRIVQVMVWDGANAAFSWDISGTGGTIASIPANLFPFISTADDYRNMTDMDVVVHSLNGISPLRGYAIVVGRKTDGFIGWVRFDIVQIGSSITFNLVTGPNTYGTLGNSEFCSNPNIDVNNNGFVGICWSESRDLSVEYNFTPPIIPGGPFSLTIQRSDVFAAYGWIDGRSVYSIGSPIRGVVNPNGDKINLHFAPGLSEKNEFPDIAIKDDTRNVTSILNDIIPSFITWSHTMWDMSNFVLHSDVKVQEVIYPGLLANVEHTLNTGTSRGYSGIPRIAARPLQLDPMMGPIIDNNDYQIVFSAEDINCTVTGSRILNWGRHNNGTINSATPVVITDLFLPGLTLGTTTAGKNHKPVVTYQNTNVSGNIGNYIVAWEHQRTGVTGIAAPPANLRDIIATTLQNGSLAPTVNNVSFVNRRCGSSPGTTGNQFYPSIAGRYATTNGYNFYDLTSLYIAYKTSLVTPGSSSLGTPPGSLRLSNEIENTNSTDLILSPNPTKSSLDVKLTDKNSIEEIEIYSSNGQLVMQKEAVKNNSENIDVSKLANGIYIISVKTVSGETLNKEFIKE